MRLPQFRLYTTSNQKSRHMLWYTETVPALIPVFLLGSAVYLGLELSHLHLSHEKYMEDATKRIKELEAEVETLQVHHDEPRPSKEGWRRIFGR